MNIDYKVGIWYYKYSDLKNFVNVPDEIEKLHLTQKEIIAHEIFRTLRNIHDIKKRLQKKSRTRTKLKELQALSKYYDKYINNENKLFSISFYGWSIDSAKEIKEVIEYELREATIAVEEIHRETLGAKKDITILKKECYSKIIYILKNHGISHKPNKITSNIMSFFDLKINERTTPYKNISSNSFTKQSQIQLQKQYFKIPFLLPNKYSQTIPKDLREYYFIELILE